MESVLAQLAHKERHRVRMVSVDVDEQAELARRFGIREVPSLVLLRDDGRPVGRREGRVSGAQIEALLDAHLVEHAAG
jgi:thioredoxin-like negative regulator of GroEL